MRPFWFFILLSMVLLATPGFTTDIRRAKACKEAKGTCRLATCLHDPWERIGKCGDKRTCCIRKTTT